MGQCRVHLFVVSRIHALLAAIFGAASIQSQAQIGIGERDEFNDPEPDVAVVRGTLQDYLTREPDPTDEIILAVEAANTTVLGDTTVKMRLYAYSGVPEYWEVVFPRSQLIVH